MQRAVDRELRLDRFEAQILLVDDQQRRDVLEPRAGPIAVDQEPIGRRLRRDDDREPVDIGRDRFGAAPRIDALDEVAARLDGLDRRAVGRRQVPQ
jgi:hypothetical protein